MTKSNYRLFGVMLILIIGLTGCTKLIKPESNFSRREPFDTSRLAGLKFAYRITVVERENSRTAQKALLDSFASLGIVDVKPGAADVWPDRVHVGVYLLASKPGFITRNTPWPLWAFVSGMTFALLPVYGEEIYPVEIQIIDRGQEKDKRFNVVSSEYVIADLIWLPLALLSNKYAGEDTYYAHGLPGTTSIAKMEKLEYLGFRRIFDDALSNVINNKRKSTD
jgi:hypothetical protein